MQLANKRFLNTFIIREIQVKIGVKIILPIKLARGGITDVYCYSE